MFSKNGECNRAAVAPGVTRATLCFGALTLMTEFRLAAGSALPPHAHPSEQTGYLVSGRLRLAVEGCAQDVEPGDSWCIPGGVEHGATALEDAVALEVFAPVREDYLPVRPDSGSSVTADAAPSPVADAGRDRAEGAS